MMRIGYYKKTLYYWDEERQVWDEMRVDKQANELLCLGYIDENMMSKIKMYTDDYKWNVYWNNKRAIKKGK